jgi:hypothetical protein
VAQSNQAAAAQVKGFLPGLKEVVYEGARLISQKHSA